MAIQQLKTAYLQIIRLAAVALLVATVAAGCRKQTPDSGYHPPKQAERTVVLYMPGRSLIYYSKQNLNAIARAINATVPGNGRMIVAWQPEAHSKAVLQEFYYNTASRSCEVMTLKEYDDFEAADPAKVAAMLADAVAAAPANRYGLIIGCHGKAWIPASSGVLPWSVRPGSVQDKTWVPAPGALQTRSFGDSGHELDITQLAEVLGSQSARFDYLIFDDCFMASIETLYDLRHAVDYIVASPCEIMAAGFPYDRILPYLFNTDTSREQLAMACYEFWNFYQNDWDSISGNMQSGCISLAVTAELDALAAEMRRVSQAPKMEFDATQLQYYKGGTTKLFYDLGQFVEWSCADTGVAEDFKAQLERAFPTDCRYQTPNFYSAYNNALNPISYYSGVTTSEPETAEPYATDCRQTSWYIATH